MNKTPEQEAEELIEQHYKYADGWINHGYDVAHSQKRHIESAKKSALITVDKIMAETQYLIYHGAGFREVLRQRERYWQKVRAAIESKI